MEGRGDDDQKDLDIPSGNGKIFDIARLAQLFNQMEIQQDLAGYISWSIHH